MKAVKFLYGATIFEKDGSTTDVNKNETFDVAKDSLKDGYRYLTITVGNKVKDVIFDSEDMRLC